MIEKTLARRYAAALIAIAAREKIVDEIGDHLMSFADAYRSTLNLRQYLGHPRVSKEEKKRTVRTMVGGKVHPILIEFLSLLIDKGRSSSLPAIAEIYDKLDTEYKGVARVKVTAFTPVSLEQETVLRVKLEKLLGRTVTIESKVDRSIKGGLVVRIDDLVIDGSVVHRMKKIRESLLGALA